MSNDFYNQMLEYKRNNLLSSREFAKKCGLGQAWAIEFFNPKRPFRKMRDVTMAKIHNVTGIPYTVMEEFNEKVVNEYGENTTTSR